MSENKQNKEKAKDAQPDNARKGRPTLDERGHIIPATTTEEGK
jgi:hypothetical protein